MTIEAKEIWSEDNVMSDLKIPISVDSMVEHLLGPINNQSLKFEGAQASLVFNYHKSLAQCVVDPSKLLRVINQVSNLHLHLKYLQSTKKLSEEILPLQKMTQK